MQKLPYRATPLTNTQEAANPRVQPHRHAKIKGESNKFQFNSHGEMNSNTESSRNKSLGRSSSRSKRKGATEHGINKVPSNKFTPTTFDVKSLESAERAPFCRICLWQSHKESECALISSKVQAKFINDRIEIMKTVKGRKEIPNKPKHGPWRPSLPASMFSTQMTKRSRTASSHRSKV